MSTTRFDRDGPSWTLKVPASRMDDVFSYIAGHDLLPPDFDGSSPAAQMVIDVAISVLRLGDVSRLELLEAIEVLGHCERLDGLEALRRYAASGEPLAGVADLASQECASLLARPVEALPC
jgi:hypothetical protein